MATKMKALIGFGGMLDDQLLMAATTILAAMTGNANFPTPTPALEDVQDLLDDFSTKLAAARKRGSPEDTAIKDESIPALVSILQKLGYYVNSVADGKLSVLLSSGFPTNAPATTSLAPFAVQDVRLSDTNQSGQARLNFVKQPRVRVYEYCYRRVGTPEEPWSDRITTTSSRNNIIAPLEPGHYYEVRVRAVNSKGAGDWSNTARLLVR
ncbi:fibronectin type III domain-containing protein [Sphingobacterium sp. C459-1T]|uniref:Fibronectin type III domain-containing protein n=1 Tax=Sphingobacterium faecale TaxID=2803775 RepID=A0ABS1R0J6_9SPHI|nr:fibronectin type III domain-containing protein [Sphingobacterium faecale]MBL1408222.1 fibronectin type III domain-containing protein [Sphingobacterium faecale]